MRVLVEVSPPVEDSRQVELRLDSGDLIASHAMKASPGEAHAAAEMLQRLEQDKTQAGDVLQLGRHLFDCLLGGSAWTAVVDAAASRGDGVVELALAWPAGEHDLNRLPWEAMHDGSGFIGGHRELCVAVTRIVTDAEQTKCGPPAPAPARVLFVLGSDLSDRDIRNGTEVIGLLRDAERGDGAIDPYVLDEASLELLAEACTRFDPDIVHVVGHGQLRQDGTPVVRLGGDASHDGWTTAEDLLGALTTPSGLPRLVLLTGCDSSASGKHMDSLAAALVKGGVPKAIGMAGKISDPVCRLFVRRFGSALNAGEAIVEAMAHGRRAGLRRQNASAADNPSWALPSIYLAPSVPPDHAPVDVSAQAAVLRRIEWYDLRQDPVFCGRRPFMRLFDNLLDPADQLQVLMAYAEDGRRVGKTRMLHELAGRALRRGHVVVMIDDVGNDPELPKTQLEIGVYLLRAIVKARLAFGLEIPPHGALIDELIEISDDEAELDLEPLSSQQRAIRLLSFLGKRSGDIDGEALRLAIAADLAQLIADARAAPDDDSVGAASQAVVILGGLGKWDEAATTLLDTLLGPAGLGSPDERVPVFAVGSRADWAGERLRTHPKLDGKPWAVVKELGAFGKDEAALAYQWVLLHPRTTVKTKYSDLVYTPMSGYEDSWHEEFDDCICGIPGKFDEDMFYAVAKALSRGHILAADDDARALAAYAEQLALERQA